MDAAQEGGEEPEAVADARRFGMSADAIAALAAHLASPVGDGTFAGVWPHNFGAVDAFLAGASQWRAVSRVLEGQLMTYWIGLDYAGVAVAHAALELEVRAADWAGMQIMERAARDAMNGVNA